MRFRCLWPVLDPTRGDRTLIAEAEADLSNVVREAGINVKQLTDLRWSVEGGHVCLLADVSPVERKSRPRVHAVRCGGCGCFTKEGSGNCRRCDEEARCEPVERWVRRGLIWRAA